MASVMIIIPSCLKVESAMIFFKSCSKLAPSPAINIVTDAISRSVFWVILSISLSLIRIRRYTPAVTSVEEWTRAETGVGAAIAAGNQAENGI